MFKNLKIIPIVLVAFMAACSSVSEEEQAAIDDCIDKGTATKSECECMIPELLSNLNDEEKAIFLSDEEGNMDSGMKMIGKMMMAMGACGISME